MYFTMLLKLNENSRDMSSCPSPGCTCVDVIAAAVPLWAEFCRRGGALSRPSVASDGGEPLHSSTVALWVCGCVLRHAPTGGRPRLGPKASRPRAFARVHEIVEDLRGLTQL